MPTKQAIVNYLCNICHTEYCTKKEAENCERMPVEKRVFKIGDQVQAVMEKFNCSNCGLFSPVGRVTAANSLVGKDGLIQDYVNRWLHGTEVQRLLGKMHLRRYGTVYACPKCGRSWGGLFFTAELRQCRQSKKKTV